ncbi:hypothetical protein R1flu_008387 [Riccia fluitans]|uniref:Ubiquitin-like protease family profile domain-containing protein n=1 Tax=Riccia fluitans TaxID=41844 RepID=A0ABD1YEN2_9MARC
MARNKKRTRRQSTEFFDFDLVAIAMEAAEEQEDKDLQLIPLNGIPGSIALGINFNCDIFKHDFLMRDTTWKCDALTIVPDEASQPDHPAAATDGSSLSSFENGVPLPSNAGAEAPTSRKGKEKVAMQPENAFEDEVRKELRELKEAITMSRREAKAIARSQKETTTRLGQSSTDPSNHMEGTDVHRGQPAASLKTKSASMVEYRNTVARMLEECEWAVERNTSLEEELVIAQRKIAKLEQRVKKSEVEKRKMLMDMEEEAHPDELSLARDGHVSRNVVDVTIENAERRLVLTTVHKVLSECPQLFYEHLKSIFDSYINPDNNLDVQPLVKGLDAKDFDVDAFLGTNMVGRKEEMTPDFLDGLSVHDARRLESKIENIREEPQQVTRATAHLRLNYEHDVLPPPIAEENIIDSTVVPIVGCSIDLTTDEAVDEPCSPLDCQIISVVSSQRVDLTIVVSIEANRCISTKWPRLSDLTKEDCESTNARKHLCGDVINAYIFEKFLQRSHEELFNMFYYSTFWFAKACQKVDAYDMTSYSESASIGMKRLRNAIYPQLHDGDFKVHLEIPTWIFVPIHGRCHWSLALIQLLGITCAMTHLDSFPGIHKEYIFHILRTFLRLTLPNCPETIVCGTMEVFDATKLSRFSISVDCVLSMVEENAKRSHSKYLPRMFVSL